MSSNDPEVGELVSVLRNLGQAYPESVFPTPPEHLRAKDNAAADVMREMALPWFEKAADRIAELEEALREIATVRAQHPHGLQKLARAALGVSDE